MLHSLTIKSWCQGGHEPLSVRCLYGGRRGRPHHFVDTSRRSKRLVCYLISTIISSYRKILHLSLTLPTSMPSSQSENKTNIGHTVNEPAIIPLVSHSMPTTVKFILPQAYKDGQDHYVVTTCPTTYEVIKLFLSA